MYNIIESLTLIFAGLKQAIAPHRDMPKDRFDLLARTWLHLHRMRNRLERLYSRWKNGTLPRPGARRPSRAGEAKPRPAFVHLPRHRGWLLLNHHAATARSQLAHFLVTHPDMPAFLEAAPQAGRILRPLCHMLRIDLARPHGLELPHLVPIAAAPARAPRPAPATPSPPQATAAATSTPAAVRRSRYR